jgi:hypothetical protein
VSSVVVAILNEYVGLAFQCNGCVRTLSCVTVTDIPEIDLAGIREHFRRHHWVLVPGAVPPDVLEPAMRGVRRMYPSSAQLARESRNPKTAPFLQAREQHGTGRAFRDGQFVGLYPFPFRNAGLNALALCPGLIDLAEHLLEEDDVRLYQAEASAKYTGFANYDQPLHVDYVDHTMLPPRSDGRYRQVQMFVYLSDVTPERGPTRVVSWERTQGLPIEQLIPGGEPVELDADERAAVGPAGSVLCYSADTVHRGSNLAEPGAVRYFLHLGWRPAGVEWMGGNPWPRLGNNRNWRPLVESLGPRQLKALGFPPPGHDYWDDETLTKAQRLYPGLDLTPWKQAVADAI